MGATFEHSFYRISGGGTPGGSQPFGRYCASLRMCRNLWAPAQGLHRGFLKTLWFEEENMIFLKIRRKETFSQNHLFLALPQLKALFCSVGFLRFKRPQGHASSHSRLRKWQPCRGPLILDGVGRCATEHAKGKEGCGLPGAACGHQRAPSPRSPESCRHASHYTVS